jgi:hypothetical protein
MLEALDVEVVDGPNRWTPGSVRPHRHSATVPEHTH